MAKRKRTRYRFSVCRYAPETFEAWRRKPDGSYERFWEVYRSSDLGYLFITKGADAVIVELKRRDRMAAKERTGITYGFYYEESRSEYAFFRELYTFDLRLESRLALYKRIKREMEENKWQHRIGTTAVLGENYQVASTTEQIRNIDSGRPCTIQVSR